MELQGKIEICEVKWTIAPQKPQNQGKDGKSSKNKENSRKLGGKNQAKTKEEPGKNQGRTEDEPGKNWGRILPPKKPGSREMGKNLPSVQFYRILMWKG